MTRRFTVIEKWTDDKWFKSLTASGKLMFLFLCENCDAAGIWEIDTQEAAYRMGLNKEIAEQALVEIQKCYIRNERFLMLVNFLYHQGNLPLRENVGAHRAILKMLEKHRDLFTRAKEIWQQKGYVLGAPSLFDWPGESKGSVTLTEGLAKGSGIGIGKGNSNGSTITNSKDKLIGDCGKTNLLDLDLEIARRRNKLASTIDQLLHPHGIEKQTFKHILSYLVQQVQTGRAELDIFDKVSQWAEQAAFSNVSNKKGLFVEKVKQETGFQGQKRLLKSCSS